jgi:hypothetical protein
MKWIDRIGGGARVALPACAIDKNFTFATDYQPVVNPAYNGDRGPVSIFSCRLRGEFRTRRHA